MNAETSNGWTDRLIDPIIVQAERIFAHRKARNQVLGSDLFGEPSWEILLYAFIAAGNSRVCVVGPLAEELGLSESDTRSWIKRLSERGLIEDYGVTITITSRAKTEIRQLLSAGLRDMMHEFGPGDGLIQFSSTGMNDEA